MPHPLSILWNPSDTALSFGPFTIHWYSLCWLIGLALAYLIVQRLYREQKVKEGLFDPLFVYCFIGILVGARLGHCLFYQPDIFLSSWRHFVEIFIPIEFLSDGSWHFTGYRGLASHGGTLGLMIALWAYVRKTGMNLWQVLDNIAIATPVTACFIRLGNLFGLCLAYIFTARFFIEFTKEVQEAFEASLPLDMGQLLSLPFIVLGVACMAGGKWMDKIAKRKQNNH